MLNSAEVSPSKYLCSLVNSISPPDSDISRVALPALTQVRGAFNLTSSGQFDCSAFQKLSSNKAIKGKFYCPSSQSKSNPSSTTSGDKASKTGAAIHFEANMPIILSASSVLATFLQFFL